MSDIANTIDCVITFGKMWRLTMRRSEKPAALAARTYSCSFATSISPRTMRAYDTHPTNAIAMYMLRVPAPEHEDERDDEDEERERDEHVDDPHDHGVEPAAPVARRALRAPCRSRTEISTARKPTWRSIRRAVEQARPDVAAEVVGAEQVLRRRRLEDVEQVLLDRVPRRDEGREDRQHGERAEDEGPGDERRRPVPPVAERAPLGDLGRRGR